MPLMSVLTCGRPCRLPIPAKSVLGCEGLVVVTGGGGGRSRRFVPEADASGVGWEALVR